jgi:sarcosine oxidase subunit beta
VRTLLWLFPSLSDVQMLRSWARYEAVTPDDRFIVGPVAGVGGFLMAAGDCGTGFVRAPMIGRLLAEMAADGRTSMPLAPYALERFAPRPAARSSSPFIPAKAGTQSQSDTVPAALGPRFCGDEREWGAGR